jgi:hypothetical protein
MKIHPGEAELFHGDKTDGEAGMTKPAALLYMMLTNTPKTELETSIFEVGPSKATNKRNSLNF